MSALGTLGLKSKKTFRRRRCRRRHTQEKLLMFRRRHTGRNAEIIVSRWEIQSSKRH